MTAVSGQFSDAKYRFMDTILHNAHMPSTLRQLFLHARRANVRGVHIAHHRVFGIPTKHLVVRRPDLSWIVRDRLLSSGLGRR